MTIARGRGTECTDTSSRGSPKIAMDRRVPRRVRLMSDRGESSADLCECLSNGLARPLRHAEGNSAALGRGREHAACARIARRQDGRDAEEVEQVRPREREHAQPEARRDCRVERVASDRRYVGVLVWPRRRRLVARTRVDCCSMRAAASRRAAGYEPSRAHPVLMSLALERKLSDNARSSEHEMPQTTTIGRTRQLAELVAAASDAAAGHGSVVFLRGRPAAASRSC